MRTIQGSFPYLLDDIPYEENRERGVISHLMVLLHNFKTRPVGVNQITNSFILHLLPDSEHFTNEYHTNIIHRIKDEEDDNVIECFI